MSGNVASDDTSYPYMGVPLTSAIAQFLIRKLFAGKLAERQIIVDEVLRAHLAGGGLKAAAQNVTGIIKKALGDMKEKGAAENRSVGYWRINDPTGESTQPTAFGEALVAPEIPTVQPSVAPEPAADVELGTGSSAIYLYYLPTYRLRAQEQGERVWPCKIGRTDRDPLSRVLSQAATALPERPRIAVIIRTSRPSAWEAALHGVLTLRGLQIENSPGVEWFLTSPDEIVELAIILDPTISNRAIKTDADPADGA